MDNIAHHLGVTDRYIGYRNNLTRNVNQPLDIHTIWADRKLPQGSTPDWKSWTHAFQRNRKIFYRAKKAVFHLDTDSSVRIFQDLSTSTPESVVRTTSIQPTG